MITSILYLVTLIAVVRSRPLSLSTLNWTLSNRNGSVSVESAPVPGYVLEALQSSGIIGDPLYR